MENIVEEKGLRLDDLKVTSLPELQGWKEKQEQLVIDNPFVEIIDNKSYEIACKSRTSLLKGRTELEKQDKLIASKLTAFRKDVKSETESLIAITLPSEEKQQEEVKRYENIKAVAKAEEERIERERIEKIEKKISDFESDSYKIIQETNIGNVEEHKIMLDAFVNDEFDYEEYEIMFEQARIRVQSYWDNKCSEVQEKEEQRLENERLKELNLEIERKAKELQDRLDLEQREREIKEVQQKDEQFDIRKNRLFKLGFECSDGYFGNPSSGLLIPVDNVIFADVVGFEELINTTESHLADEKQLNDKKAKEAKEQKAIDLELSKKDAIRLKIENAERVTRLAFDKENLSLILSYTDLYFKGVTTENQEIKDFIEQAEVKIKNLKEELLTQLKDF